MAVGSTLDPYAALGVPQDAAPAALRSAYKKLMLQCHPDKVRDEAQRAEKAQQFQKVQEAYELLIDPRRRRKYDEELARKGPAAAQAAAANGGSNGAKPTPSTSANPASGGDEGVKKERRRRRHDEEHRRTREEAGFDAKDREERQSYQRRFRKAEEMGPAEEAMRASERAQYEREQRHKEEQRKHSPSSRHAHGSSTANRYTSADELPPLRKSPYERPPPSQQQHVPRSAPPPQPSSRPPPAQPEPRGPPSETDTEKPAVRPGYEETRAAEDAKLEAVRRRLRETQAGLGSARAQHGNGHEEDPYVKSQTRATVDQIRQQQVQAERLRVEQERLAREKSEQRKARQAAKEQQSDHSERCGRATDIPANRPRKVSPPMGRRRGSSSVSRDDFATMPPFTTKPPMNDMFSGSVPTTSYGTPPHIGGPGYPQVRRRHSLSSPSPDKQNSRLQRDQQAPCDSGYSSPSPNNDTTPSCTFEKKHVSSNLNPTPSPTVPKADG